MRKIKCTKDQLTDLQIVQVNVFLKMLKGIENEVSSSDWLLHDENTRRILRGMHALLDRQLNDALLQGRKINVTGRKTGVRWVDLNVYTDKAAHKLMMNAYLSEKSLFKLKECEWNNSLPQDLLKTLVTLMMGYEYIISVGLITSDLKHLYFALMNLFHIKEWATFEKIKEMEV